MSRTGLGRSRDTARCRRGAVVVLAAAVGLFAGCGDSTTRPAGPGGSGGTPATGGSGGTAGIGGSGGSVGSGGSGGTGGNAGTGGLGGSGGAPGTGGSGGGGNAAGSGGAGGMGPCATNALCHTCPDRFLCDTDDDCAFSGYVCVASGCETHAGAPIKQCQPSRGPSCSTDADCPNTNDYDCLTVGAGSTRCVRVSGGCDLATETIDCAPGFSCEGSTCVDRRLPCDSYLDCPKSHVCTATQVSSYCIRTHRTCQEDVDCGGFASAGDFCADVDGDGTKECVGQRGSSGQACTNADCGSGLVCESGAAPSAASCGDYGLCLDNNDCGAGFVCVSLWQDGRKECVPTGGTCNEVTDCRANEVCAAPRNGGSPRCQAGKEAL